MPPDSPVEDAYDELSDSYETQEQDPYCAHIEFPAMTGLLPEVAGDRILDAGCGHGRYAAWLRERDARVVAVDASRGMVEQARTRLDEDVTVRRADIGEPLSFADDDAFDGIVSGLTLQYLEDWAVTFREFARVLRPGGFLVFSTHHPLDDYVAFDATNYFETERVEMPMAAGDTETTVPFYRRPFGEVVSPLLTAGFRLDGLVEPTPTAAFADAKPESAEKRRTYPTFLCVRAVLDTD